MDKTTNKLISHYSFVSVSAEQFYITFEIYINFWLKKKSQNSDYITEEEKQFQDLDWKTCITKIFREYMLLTTTTKKMTKIV